MPKRFIAGSAYLFAYGTLVTGTRSGVINALVQSALRPLGEGWIQARLHDLGSYPGAVPSARPGDRVRGRVYAVRGLERVLETLDLFEGFDPGTPERSHFVRRLVHVTRLPSKRSLLAWAYYYNRGAGGAPRIPGGDYAAWLRRRPGARGR